MHSYIYTIADKYLVENLRNLAKNKSQLAISEAGEKELCIFTSVLKAVFQGSPENDRALRDPCVSFVCKWYRSLRDRREFRDFLKANGDVCLEILEQMSVPASMLEQAAATVKMAGGPRLVFNKRPRLSGAGRADLARW